MTDKQIQIKIADILGYLDIHEEDVSYSPHETILIANPPLEKFIGIGSRKHKWVDVPNYLQDLNACVEFENTLPKGKDDVGADGWYAYCGHLIDVAGDGCLMSSTARQRCEAFLKTIGKWEESC